MTESQYQALVRIVAEAYKKQREVKKDGRLENDISTEETDTAGSGCDI